MIRNLLLLSCFILSSAFANAYTVTFRLNMNGIAGFQIPELNGSFNNWCGNCNAMSDVDNDGIWETTITLNAGYYEYKFSFDSWTGQENLSANTSGCTITNGNFTNRILTVSSDTTLAIVCWGLCGNCIPANTETWNLAWTEEFNGNALNTAVWTPEIGTGVGGWGNNELQYYTDAPENLLVSEGSLKIIAKKETINQSDYSSARIITKDKYDFK